MKGSFFSRLEIIPPSDLKRNFVIFGKNRASNSHLLRNIHRYIAEKQARMRTFKEENPFESDEASIYDKF